MDDPKQSALADQVLKGIEQNAIPPCPAILLEVVSESRKPEPDLRQLTNIISGDVGIAASLLKTVNSPFYGLSGKAQTIQQAVNLLGVTSTVNAVASIALRGVLPPPPQLERFWDGSMKIACLSGWLAQKMHSRVRISADLAYTFALFRDAGIPIMISKFPDYYATLSEANACPERMFTRIEEERHATSHALVGYLLAQAWWLSTSTSQAIRHHHDFNMISLNSRILTAETCELISLAQLAEYLLQQFSGQSRTREWDKMGAAIQARLQLTDNNLKELAEEASKLTLSAE